MARATEPNALDFHPRKFADTSKAMRDASEAERWKRFREVRDRSHRERNAMCKRAERLTPADAVSLAQTLLVHVEAAGIDYSDFQSAQAVERYVHKAVLALRGLSLS